MRAIQKHCAILYARGALPWPVFLDQLEKHKPPPPPRTNHGSKAMLERQRVASEKLVRQAIVFGREATIGHLMKETNLSKSAALRHCKTLLAAGSIAVRKGSKGEYIYTPNKEK